MYTFKEIELKKMNTGKTESKTTFLTPIETLKLRRFLSSFEKDVMWYTVRVLEYEYDTCRNDLIQDSYLSMDDDGDIFFYFGEPFGTFQVPNDHVLWKFFIDWNKVN